jgi:ammonia channel protein AmtB
MAAQASLSAINTFLGAAGAAMVSTVWALKWPRRVEFDEYVMDLSDVLCCTVCGLVSISSCCAYIENWEALLIGMSSPFVYMLVNKLMLHYHLDDPSSRYTI